MLHFFNQLRRYLQPLFFTFTVTIALVFTGYGSGGNSDLKISSATFHITINNHFIGEGYVCL